MARHDREERGEPLVRKGEGGVGLPGYNPKTALRQYLESFVQVSTASGPDTTSTLPAHWRIEDRLESGQVAALIAAYRAGATSRDLASAYGISKTAVISLLRRHRVQVREPGKYDRI